MLINLVIRDLGDRQHGSISQVVGKVGESEAAHVRRSTPVGIIEALLPDTMYTEIKKALEEQKLRINR